MGFFIYLCKLKNLITTFIKYFLFVIVLILLIPGYSVSQNNNGNGVIYEIDEINVNFKGLKTFDEDDLKNLLASKEGNPFDMETYLKDVERIKKFYFDNGFFDAKLIPILCLKKRMKKLLKIS